MTFSIRLTVEPAFNDGGQEIGRMGSLTVDRHVQDFPCPLGFWDADAYQAHWRAGLQRIANGATSSCRLTAVGDLRIRQWWPWWLLYRRHTMVIFREAFFLPWTMAFCLKAPSKSVPTYGSSVSAEEWRVSVRSIEEFLTRPDDTLPSFQLPRRPER